MLDGTFLLMSSNFSTFISQVKLGMWWLRESEKRQACSSACPCGFGGRSERQYEASAGSVTGGCSAKGMLAVCAEHASADRSRSPVTDGPTPHIGTLYDERRQTVVSVRSPP